MSQDPVNWPPKLIFNTDGNWMRYYLKRRRPEDITMQLTELAGASVDALSVLIGLDDDVSWRGSPHADMWGDNITVWDPDGQGDKIVQGGQKLSEIQQLYRCLTWILEDGNDLMQSYIDGARRRDMAIYASLRMNDAHTQAEDRAWMERSNRKLQHTDLLIGTPVPERCGGEQWGFSWQWDYAHQEVRDRFLGLIEETLTRYNFDGVELDFCRAPVLFRPGESVRNIPTLTGFVRQAREVVGRCSQSKDKNLKLIVRVPPSIGESLALGIDTETWIREGLADVVALASQSLCPANCDVADAVSYARDNGVLIYTGFDPGARKLSPQEGTDLHPPSVLRAVSLNGYEQGAAGVHLFNYDTRFGIKSHHFEEAEEGKLYSEVQLQTLRELADPSALAASNRCYSVQDYFSYYDQLIYHNGDHRPQVPYKLPVMGRGAGPNHVMRITIEDDLEKGVSEGRIKKTELRIRLIDHEDCLDRVRCRVNGQAIDFNPDRQVKNQWDETWQVFDNPPVRRGGNTVFLALEGLKTPDPWPSVRQCEVLVLCSD